MTVNWSDLKKGDRIEVIALQNDPRPLPVGSVGTVEVSTRMGVTVDWDNGSALGLALPEDSHCIRKVA